MGHNNGVKVVGCQSGGVKTNSNTLAIKQHDLIDKARNSQFPGQNYIRISFGGRVKIDL